MDPVNIPAKSFTRSWDNSGYFKTLGSPWIRRSRSSKVIDFGTNRKRVYDFLLVPHSILVPILHRFGDIAGFFVLLGDPPISPQFLGVFPLHQITHARAEAIYAIRPWNYFRSIPTYVITVPERYRQTDGRTDRQTTYCGITVLCRA